MEVAILFMMPLIAYILYATKNKENECHSDNPTTEGIISTTINSIDDFFENAINLIIKKMVLSLIPQGFDVEDGVKNLQYGECISTERTYEEHEEACIEIYTISDFENFNSNNERIHTEEDIKEETDQFTGKIKTIIIKKQTSVRLMAKDNGEIVHLKRFFNNTKDLREIKSICLTISKLYGLID